MSVLFQCYNHENHGGMIKLIPESSSGSTRARHNVSGCGESDDVIRRLTAHNAGARVSSEKFKLVTFHVLILCSLLLTTSGQV